MATGNAAAQPYVFPPSRRNVPLDRDERVRFAAQPSKRTPPQRARIDATCVE